MKRLRHTSCGPRQEFGEPRAVRPRVLDFDEKTRGLTAHGSPRISLALPSRQDLEQMANLIVDLVGRGDSVGDLISQQLAVTFAEAMCGDSQGGFGRVQLASGIRIVG